MSCDSVPWFLGSRATAIGGSERNWNKGEKAATDPHDSHDTSTSGAEKRVAQGTKQLRVESKALARRIERRVLH